MATDESSCNESLHGTGPSDAGPPTQRSRTQEQIEQWFSEYLAKQLDTPVDRIDVTVPFDDFALDSATAIAMTGDLEDWLGQTVDPMLVYDYPTIADLAEYLSREEPSADSA